MCNHVYSICLAGHLERKQHINTHTKQWQWIHFNVRYIKSSSCIFSHLTCMLSFTFSSSSKLSKSPGNQSQDSIQGQLHPRESGGILLLRVTGGSVVEESCDHSGASASSLLLELRDLQGDVYQGSQHHLWVLVNLLRILLIAVYVEPDGCSRAACTAETENDPRTIGEDDTEALVFGHTSVHRVCVGKVVSDSHLVSLIP